MDSRLARAGLGNARGNLLKLLLSSFQSGITSSPLIGELRSISVHIKTQNNNMLQIFISYLRCSTELKCHVVMIIITQPDSTFISPVFSVFFSLGYSCLLQRSSFPFSRIQHFCHFTNVSRGSLPLQEK